MVLISHNHYDHLEYKTIRYLKNGNTQFVAPLGVGAILKSWGVDKNKIHELGWGDFFEYNGIKITAERANHFSRRNFKDGNKTLFVSYAIAGASKKIFFSGDTGYASFFKDIGKKYGKFDLALVEIDAWNNGWPNTHMFPKGVMDVVKDINADMLMPVHWGVFYLALHPWSESIEMVFNLAKENGVKIITPVMGQRITSDESETREWWKDIV
jgi:L-ascorbate metabolism protein UlaG (beta-lactamase superfamily)